MAVTPESRAGSASRLNFYCLDRQHSKELVTPDRFFAYDGDGCPVCPVCKDKNGGAKMVAANSVQIVNGVPQIPRYLLGVDERLRKEI